MSNFFLEDLERLLNIPITKHTASLSSKEEVYFQNNLETAMSNNFYGSTIFKTCSVFLPFIIIEDDEKRNTTQTIT